MGFILFVFRCRSTEYDFYIFWLLVLIIEVSLLSNRLSMEELSLLLSVYNIYTKQSSFYYIYVPSYFWFFLPSIYPFRIFVTYIVFLLNNTSNVTCKYTKFYMVFDSNIYSSFHFPQSQDSVNTIDLLRPINQWKLKIPLMISLKNFTIYRRLVYLRWIPFQKIMGSLRFVLFSPFFFLVLSISCLLRIFMSKFCVIKSLMQFTPDLRD